MRRNEKMKWKRTAGLLLAGTLALTGCSTGTGAGSGESSETAATAATTAAGVTAAETTVEEREETTATEGAEESVSRETVEFMKAAQMETKEGNLEYFSYNAKEDGFDSNRVDIMSPAFYIFAGNMDEKGANELVSDLGMAERVQKWAGTIFVVNPLNGSEYGEKDLEAFLELVNSQGAAKNVKVVGIEDGGTFVNNYVSQKCYFVSGMFVYGGEMEEGLDYFVPVPVYLSGDDQTAADYYTKANEGVNLAVVETGTEDDLGTAFDNAWNKVLSKNYRIYDWTTEFYSSNIMDHNTPYEFNEIPDFDALGIRYITCKDEKVSGMDGAYSWFEYVPETAAREGFIVVSPEWQPSDINFTGCDGLGEEGVTALIGDLMEKYPQIDPSRVYISGLSAGGAFSFMMGIRHSDVFAAAAPVSGVNSFAAEIKDALENYTGHGTPLLYMCGDYDFFQMIPVDGSSPNGMPGLWESDENVRIFSALQAYQKTLGLTVSEEPDMAAILDQPHWNYKGEADYIWNFFSRYSRDVESGEIVFEK